MFVDHAFPKGSEDFDELSNYLELQSDAYLTLDAFDELWELYILKYKS
jgi:uncharacterized protein YozE (UPF0346 family)